MKKKYLCSSLPPLQFMLILVGLLRHCSANEPYKPIDNIAVNCGFSNNSTANDNPSRIWTGDQTSKYLSIDSKTSTTSTAPPRRDVRDVPYGTVRLSRSPFTYSFPVTAGPKFIRLHFYPFNYSNFSRSDAFFSVTSGSYTLLNNFSAALTADHLSTSVFFREFCVNMEDNQRLNLAFTPSSDNPNAYAFINGIEVVSMPVDLYYDSLPSAKTSSSEVEFLNDHAVALETLYRINVGGSQISYDTGGMYRTWEAPDDDYVTEDPNSSVLPVDLTTTLNFTLIPSYAAPVEMYRTARSMGTNSTINYSYNLTWSFMVDSNFNYLVRLHFCEIVREVNVREDRSFQIFITTIMTNIIQWNGSKGMPIYHDYIINMFDPENKRLNLSIALHPGVSGVDTRFADAILNGVEIFKISGNDRNLAGPNYPPSRVLVTPSTPPELPSKSSNISKTTIASIAGGVASGIVVLCLLGFLIFRPRKEENPAYNTDVLRYNRSSVASNLCRHFSLSEIKGTTKNFADASMIGVGGFGRVYRAHMGGGIGSVAIKRCSPGSKQGAHEFMTEIETLSQLRHRHLVSLVGCCSDNGEMILVYDYMTHGTIRDHLYNTNNPPLSWKQRLEICIGAARGFHYLHTGTKQVIIHRDIKTTNILLDDKWVAKVSDFGISKIAPTDMSRSHVSTVVKGTFGYLDPEYFRFHQLTEKSDVYSFGVVLFEVLCARPPVDTRLETEQISLAMWGQSCYLNGTLDDIIDPYLKTEIVPECLKVFGEIAMNCLHDKRNNRPSMNDVVRSLELALQLQENEGKITASFRSMVDDSSSDDDEEEEEDAVSSLDGEDNNIL